jgi:hypothetical protein
MIKIQIDMSKKIPNNIVKDIQALLNNVNDYHETKPTKVDKINVAKVKVTEAEPKSEDSVCDQPVETTTVVNIKNEAVANVDLVDGTITELDVRGLPWDARIHAKTKAKKVDGTWRNKRAVNKDLLAKVEAELKDGLSVETVTTSDEPFAEPPAMTYQPKTYTLDTFKNDLFNLINDLVNAKKIDRPYMQAMSDFLGLELGLIELNQEGNEDKLEKFYNALADANLIIKA